MAIPLRLLPIQERRDLLVRLPVKRTPPTLRGHLDEAVTQSVEVVTMSSEPMLRATSPRYAGE